MAFFSLPRRYFLPVYLVILFLLLLILVNVTLFHPGRTHEPKLTYQSQVDHVDSEEYINGLVDDLRAAKQEELLAKLQKDIETNNKAKFIDDLKWEVISNFTEIFKSDVKADVSTQFTKNVFLDHELNYKLYDDLKAEYLKLHSDQIKQDAILEAVKNIDVGLPDGFAEKAEKKLHETFSPTQWYQHLIKDLIMKHAPTVEPLTSEENGKDMSGTYYRDVQQPPISRNRLLKDHVNLPKEKFDNLQLKHDQLVDALKRLEEPPKEFVSGDGIVISGGGVYFGSALVAAGQLREMGSKLPIEIIMNTMDEYDKQICEELLPQKFNARCIVIEEQIGRELLDALKLTKFQLKIFGLLFSTFNNIITIDADNMAVKNVDNVLTLEPYLSTRMILWPDIWHKQVSPLYYDIARFKVGDYPIRRDGIANDWSFPDYLRKDKDSEVLFHDLEGLPNAISIETGQMAFSKRAHFRSFMLALYYNIYGPAYYYRLLFQGAPGDGDRETFVPALHLFQEPYHVVGHDTWLAGYQEKNGDYFQETTIVQYDPTQSLAFFADWEKWLVLKKLDPRMWPYQSNPFTHKLYDEFKKENTRKVKKTSKGKDGKVKEEEVEEPYAIPEILFMHIHKPKINPIENTKTGSFGIYTRRNLGLMGAYKEFGPTDWELKFHSIAKWIACKGITSEDFWKKVAKVEQSTTCEKVTKYVEFLKEDSTDKAAADLKYLH